MALNGTVWCWGMNSYGDAGYTEGVQPVEARDAVPVQFRGSPLVARAVHGGFATVCAVTYEDALVCWGHNPAGMLDPEGGDTVAPMRVLVGLRDDAVIRIAMGGSQACV